MVVDEPCCDDPMLVVVDGLGGGGPDRGPMVLLEGYDDPGIPFMGDPDDHCCC